MNKFLGGPCPITRDAIQISWLGLSWPGLCLLGSAGLGSAFIHFAKSLRWPALVQIPLNFLYALDHF